MWLNPSFWKLIPIKIKHRIKVFRNSRHKSNSINIYHCCVHKTGSQWIRGILSDARIRIYSGLIHYQYQNKLPGRNDPRKITERTFSDPFPRGTIISPLYISYENFKGFPKPESYKAFFVMRDPRDIVVSWYFSSRYSHTLIGELNCIRKKLNSMSMTDGLIYSIEHLHEMGLMAALQSWINASKKDSNVVLLRFEDLTVQDNLMVFKDLFLHCNIHMPEQILHQLLHEHSFERLSGRKQGVENIFSHYRKGASGEWKNYFDDDTKRKFKDVTSNLVVDLEYENNPDW